MEKEYYFIIVAIIMVEALIYFPDRQVISLAQQDEQRAVKYANKKVITADQKVNAGSKPGNLNNLIVKRDYSKLSLAIDHFKTTIKQLN